MAQSEGQNHEQDIKGVEQNNGQGDTSTTETLDDTPMLLSIQQEDIRVVAGEVIFDQLPTFKLSIERFVEKMKTVEVTEDNMAQSKKLVARTRKEVQFIDEERKRVEKFYMAPLISFKDEIKGLNAQVTEAEDHVREQLRLLENKARDEKQQEVQSIFDRHVVHYELMGIMGFRDFFKNQYTNKTYSLNKVEEELVEWLQKVESDLLFLSEQEDGEKLVAEYKDTKDVTVAIRNIENTKRYYEEMERKLNASKEKDQEASNDDYRKTKQLYAFEVQGSDVADMVEKLLKDNGIGFTRKSR